MREDLESQADHVCVYGCYKTRCVCRLWFLRKSIFNAMTIEVAKNDVGTKKIEDLDQITDDDQARKEDPG